MGEARRNPKEFTSDWFSEHIPLWESQLAGLKGQPDLSFLEIGAFEGRATLWLLSNILTDSTSRITCIDPFEERYVYRKDNPGYEQRFDRNTREYIDKISKLKGYSKDILKKIEANFQFIYIDGSHLAADVLEDAVLSWPLVTDGGILVFDDYLLAKEPEEENRPKLGIDAFLSVYRGRYEVLHLGKQVWLRKQIKK